MVKLPKKRSINKYYDEFVNKAIGAEPSKAIFQLALLDSSARFPEKKSLEPQAVFRRRVVRFYNRRPGSVNLHHSRAEHRFLLGQLDMRKLIKSDSTVTSLGSGPAITENFIAKHMCLEGHVTCIDIADKLNAYGRKLAQKQGVKNISFLKKQSNRTTIHSNSQNLVIAANANTSEKVFLEAHRILKDNSPLVLMGTIFKGNVALFKNIAARTGFNCEYERTRIIDEFPTFFLVFRKIKK